MEQEDRIKEFPNKGWGLRGLDKRLKTAARNWHDDKTKQQQH